MNFTYLNQDRKKKMKKILISLLALLVLPGLVSAQSKKQIIKQVEQRVQSAVKQQALRGSGAAVKGVAKKATQASAKKATQATAKKMAAKATAKKAVAQASANKGTQFAARKAGQVMEERALQARKKMHASTLSPQEREKQMDGLLRAQLFGDEPIFTATSYAALRKQMNSLDVAIANKNIQLAPAGRLSKETRRINTGLAQYMLQKADIKEQIIKGYALTDAFLEGYYLRRIYPYLSKPS